MYFSVSTGQHLKQESALLNWKPFISLSKAWSTNAFSKQQWKILKASFATTAVIELRITEKWE